MGKIFVFAVAALVVFLNVVAGAQTPKTPLETYLDTGKTIVVAKCLKVGPVNILLKAHVNVQILHVVKGAETLRNISIESQFGMRVGEIYLLRTENPATPDKPYFEVTSRDSVVAISPGEDIEKLKTLSPGIVVLRTMNMRVDHLESKIRGLTYELDALKAARQDN